MKTFVPVITDKKFPVRNAVYDAFRKRSPLISKAKAYEDIAKEFGISVSTVQRYIRKVETGAIFSQSEKNKVAMYMRGMTKL